MGCPTKTWKNKERKVAEFFEGERTPLSGGNGKITRADVIHDKYFIECKYRKNHSVVSLWDKTKALADTERKTPIVALCEKGRQGFWLLVHNEDWEKLK